MACCGAPEVAANSGGASARVAEGVGKPGEWPTGTPLVRIDIPDPMALNPRLPSGLESGVNSSWIPGGMINGGSMGTCPEVVTDPLLLGIDQYYVTPLFQNQSIVTPRLTTFH